MKGEKIEDIVKLQEFLNKGIFYLQQLNSTDKSNSFKAIQNLRVAGGHLERIISKIENFNDIDKNSKNPQDYIENKKEINE